MKERRPPPTNYLKVKIMPTYYKSTAKKPGGGVRKGYRRGGRNLRDEEARVIGVQDNAADELRRVRARRPHDAAERRDRRDQLARVGSRERNARDEMHRLRREAVGYQYGGGIGRSAAAAGAGANRRLSNWQGRGGLAQHLATMPPMPMPRRGRGYQAGGAIAPDMREVDRRIAELDALAIAQQLPMYGAYGEPVADHRGIDRTMGYIPPHPEDRRSSSDRLMQRGYQYGGRVGFKTGGRIPRKKKGAKFI